MNSKIAKAFDFVSKLSIFRNFLKKGCLMTVTAVTPPAPANSDIERAMFAYLSPDPIGTDTNMQNMLNFCSTQGVNLIFMDMYAYLGGSNWSSTHLTRMQLLHQMAHQSGIRVMFYGGNTDWAKSSTYNWVLTNILQKVQKYQAAATAPYHLSDGFIFDVEYWTDSQQQASVACPGLCDLMNVARQICRMPGTKFEVGCFATFYLKDSTNTRGTFSYQGKTAQDGEFLMDNSDFIVVGDYRNHANDNGTDGPGINTIHTPWHTYASSALVSAPVRNKCKLYVGVETQNITPAYTTFYGMTKAAMETELTTVSSTFKTSGNRDYYGACVDCYNSWNAMS
jgi:hypothetical protein